MKLSIGRLVVLTAVGVGLLAVYSCNTTATELSAHREQAKTALAPMSLAEETNPDRAGWQYATEMDAMRGTKTHKASLMAADYNPYTTPTLMLWRREDGSKGAQINGSMAQPHIFLKCDSDKESIAVRVDSGPVRRVGCETRMSVVIDPKLIGMIKGSSRVMIEVADEYDGHQQFTFQTAGLRF